jgi:3',5'-cyclic AMP phosphodiesterase CpdA
MNRISNTLTLLLICFFTSAHSQKTWRFAVVGDTHVGLTDTISEMIPYILADSIDLILVPGDIVKSGRACSAEELKVQLLSWQAVFAPFYKAGIGVYPLRGNHEDDARNDIAVWNELFSGSFLLPQNGPSGEVNLTYSFNHKNALFIGLDNYVNIHQVNQNWLDQQLAANTQSHVFVFGHEPAFKVFHADCLDDSVTARNTFWKSLSDAGVKTYFCGHDHFCDIAKIDDGDGNPNNDVIQYIVGTGGGPLHPRFNYNGDNSTYTLNRLFHEVEHGYSLVEVSGNEPTGYHISITWKQRNWNEKTNVNEYFTISSRVEYDVARTSTK